MGKKQLILFLTFLISALLMVGVIVLIQNSGVISWFTPEKASANPSCDLPSGDNLYVTGNLRVEGGTLTGFLGCDAISEQDFGCSHGAGDVKMCPTGYFLYKFKFCACGGSAGSICGIICCKP